MQKQDELTKYFAILTNKGTEKLAQYLQTGKKLTITHVVVGDGNGTIPTPDPVRTALVHEVWRGPAEVTGDLVNKNVIKATSVIPTDVGGWNVREIGLIDEDGELFAISNAPGYPKISIADGINNDMQVGMRVAVSNQAGINFKVDGTVIVATIFDIEEHNKDGSSHNGHFQNQVIHVSEEDRESWDNPLLVATVLLDSESWERNSEGVTYIQDVTAQLPEDTVLPNMDLAIKGDPNLIAQMVDKDIGLVAAQSGGKIVVHALRETPAINMYLQLSLYRSKTGEEKTYYSNLLGNPGEIGTPLPDPISKGSIQLEDQSTAQQLKIHGSHTNPSLDWAATRVVRGAGVAPIGPNDGVVVLDGTETEFTDTNGLKAGVKYRYAYFPRNEAGNYQMSATTAEITIPVQKPQDPTGLQAQDTTDAGAFGATLTWTADADVYRDHFALVRKEGSAPTSLEDGTLVYEGSELTFRDKDGLTFGVEYHWAVFAVNAAGQACDTPATASVSLQPKVPQQVTGMTVTDASTREDGYRFMIRYKLPADVSAFKVMVRRKLGEMPATSIDGELAYEGTNELIYDAPPFSSQGYYYRCFVVNQLGQMNSEVEGANAGATLTVQDPGPATNLTAVDDKGITTVEADLPVVMASGKEKLDGFLAGYRVIQKEGSAPENENDGTVLEEGDINPKTAQKHLVVPHSGQQHGVTYHITIFTRNAAGQYVLSSAPVAQVTPNVIPTGYEFLTCLTENTVWTPPEDGFYRINVFGKCADGTNGGSGSPNTGTSGKPGGSGGASGGFARSLLDLKTSDKINCTVNASITSFGEHLSATGATGQFGVGSGSGGNLFNLNGFRGGSGGGGYTGYTQAQDGSPGENNGASGGFKPSGTGVYKGGGGGGGARIPVPAVDYDDPLYTTYTLTSLAQYRGGSAYYDSSGGPGSSYPAFNPNSPVIYGGGNGGGGGCDGEGVHKGGAGGAGSAGSPPCIIIEKGVYK